MGHPGWNRGLIERGMGVRRWRWCCPPEMERTAKGYRRWLKAKPRDRQLLPWRGRGLTLMERGGSGGRSRYGSDAGGTATGGRSIRTGLGAMEINMADHIAAGWRWGARSRGPRRSGGESWTPSSIESSGGRAPRLPSPGGTTVRRIKGHTCALGAAGSCSPPRTSLTMDAAGQASAGRWGT